MPTTPEIIENRLIELLKTKEDMFNEEEKKIVRDWVFIAIANQCVQNHLSQYCDLPSRGY